MYLCYCSYCSSTLICHCDAGYVANENRTLCLQPFVAGNSSLVPLTCDTTQYCQSHIGNTRCRSGVCSCTSDYTPNSQHTACLPGKPAADDVTCKCHQHWHHKLIYRYMLYSAFSECRIDQSWWLWFHLQEPLDKCVHYDLYSHVDLLQLQLPKITKCRPTYVVILFYMVSMQLRWLCWSASQ